MTFVKIWLQVLITSRISKKILKNPQISKNFKGYPSSILKLRRYPHSWSQNLINLEVYPHQFSNPEAALILEILEIREREWDHLRFEVSFTTLVSSTEAFQIYFNHLGFARVP